MTRVKVHTAPTMLELKSKVYAYHGWTRRRDESMAKRIKALYGLFIDHKRDRFIAIPLDPKTEA